ncbi:37S ribosomal protein S9, mitochondrial [Nowakowskiella sp. JEL0078]|nr:37S ribosomal protein S9, mitochondrial [Nowakowskiella sp. JEL0078]
MRSLIVRPTISTNLLLRKAQTIAQQKHLSVNTHHTIARSFHSAFIIRTSDFNTPYINNVVKLDEAYFTGNPEYFKALRQLNLYIERFGPTNFLPRDHLKLPYQHENPRKDLYIDFNSDAETYKSVRVPVWMTYLEMADRLNIGFKKDSARYKDFIHRLNLLYFISVRDPSIEKVIQQYIAPGRQLDTQEPTIPQIDEFGRVFAKASRKTARAQVWLVEGDGQIYVNGMHMALYFKLEALKENIVKPFEIGEVMGRFNVWAIVNGGGKSGQSSAISTAVARTLMYHDKLISSGKLEELKKLTKINRKQVERKKTGQPGARKKRGWVKR